MLALAAAARAPVLAVVRANEVVLVDTSSPLHPARSAPRALPQAVRDAKIAAADISPDGKLLAIATEAGNQVVMLDLGPAGQAPVASALPIAPEIRESILCDVAFAPAGDTLWVLSGDTPRSAVVGPEPTQLRAVRVASDSQTLVRLTAARLVEIGDGRRAGARRRRPRVAAGERRSDPLAAGTQHRVLRGRRAARGAAAGSSGCDSEDAATVIVASPARVGRPDISPEGRWLLAPAASPDGAVRVLAAAIDGRPAPAGAARPVDALPALPGEGPPAARPAPELRIQP